MPAPFDQLEALPETAARPRGVQQGKDFTSGYFHDFALIVNTPSFKHAGASKNCPRQNLYSK
jgi:hypothetical protein